MPEAERAGSPVEIGSLKVGGGFPLVFIGGPCVIEDSEHPFRMAEAISRTCRERDIPYVFKASFDKANRTSLEGFRGPGLKEGLEILSGIRERFGLPVTTDVHEPHQAEAVGTPSM